MKSNVSSSLELQKLCQLSLILSLFHGIQQLQQQSCDGTWIVSQGAETNLSAIYFSPLKISLKVEIYAKCSGNLTLIGLLHL